MEGLLRRVRAWLVRRGDPLVRMRVGARDLEMPLSHELPVYRAMLPLYDRELPRIARLLHEVEPQFVMIDVGANIGDTAALVTDAVANAALLCVEGSDRYFEVLRNNVRRLGINAECVQAYCGDDGAATAVVGAERQGTGRLRAARGATPLPTRTLDDIVAERPQFRRPTLLKIDTDGYDAKVLRGAVRLLRAAEPVLFFEFAADYLRDAGDDPSTIIPALAALGYTHARLYTNDGVALGTFGTSDPALIDAAEGAAASGRADYLDVLA